MTVQGPEARPRLLGGGVEVELAHRIRGRDHIHMPIGSSPFGLEVGVVREPDHQTACSLSGPPGGQQVQIRIQQLIDAPLDIGRHLRTLVGDGLGDPLRNSTLANRA